MVSSVPAKRGPVSIGLDDLDEDQAVLMRPQIERERIARYFFRSQAITHLVVTIFTFGMWLPILLLWFVGFGQWYSAKRAAELDFRLLPGRLLVSDGVFTKVRKTIPLDKITDLGLVQGIFDRWFGLWKVSVQTASSGQAAPEAMLHGIIDPRDFRKAVLQQRERWLESGESPSALPAADRSSSSPAALSGPGVEDKLERIETLLATIAQNTKS